MRVRAADMKDAPAPCTQWSSIRRAAACSRATSRRDEIIAAADCGSIVTTPLEHIYNKGLATIRIVLREVAKGVDEWVFASDDVRRHECFDDRDGAEAFSAQVHDTIVGRGYRLVWNSDGAARRDAAA
jgi:hypothetical protein